MNYYELTYLISPNLSKEELEVFQKKINALIEEEGGKLETFQNPTEKALAYKIRKENRAYFTTSGFYLEPENLKNLENKLKKEMEILRYLILSEEKPKEKLPKIEIPKPKKEKKVELEKIEEKLEEILGEI